MTADTTGESDLRAEMVDTAIKAIAQATYKLKTLCTVDSSSAETETYYRETNTVLTGGGDTNEVDGVPRLAAFPYGEASWTKVSAVIKKFAMEGMISYEDILQNNIPMIARTISKISEGVVSAVDSAIHAVIESSYGNTVTIAAGSEWDSATVANRDPIKNILDGIQTLRADNIDALNGSGYLVMNGTDYTNLISNTKIVNSPTYKSADVITNGVVGELAGLKIMVTEALEATTPDVAYIVMDKLALTWKAQRPLTVDQIDDPGIKTTIRAYELGVTQIPVPNAVCKITNTRK